MSGQPGKGPITVFAAAATPLAVGAVLLPFRDSLANTNAALILVAPSCAVLRSPTR